MASDENVRAGQNGLSGNEPDDQLILFKNQLRKILHRMNNDLTAIALSVDSAALAVGNGGKSETNEERLKVLQDLISNLTRDLREMTTLCRGGSHSE